MHTILARASDLPVAARAAPPPHLTRRLLKLLSVMAQRAAERVTSPQFDVPPEFYRFPPF